MDMKDGKSKTRDCLKDTGDVPPTDQPTHEMANHNYHNWNKTLTEMAELQEADQGIWGEVVGQGLEVDEPHA